MAYVDPGIPQDDENKKKPAGAEDPSLNPDAGGAGGVGGSFYGNAPGGPAAPGTGNSGGPKSKTPGSSGSFTNLQKYLDANQEQAAAMGDKVVQGVTQETDKARDSLTGVQDTFSKGVQAGTTQGDATLFNDVALDPSAVVGDDKKSADFSKILTASGKGYAGPDDITKTEGYGDAVTNYNVAGGDVTNAGNAKGRKLLLQKDYARPDYSEGQQNFDNMLLGRSSSAQRGLQNLQDQNRNLGGDVGKALVDSGKLVDWGKATTVAAHKAAVDAINSGAQNIDTAAGTDMSRSTVDEARETGAVQNYLSSGGKVTPEIRAMIPPDVLAQLDGITSQHLYGMDAGQFLNAHNARRADEALDPTKNARNVRNTLSTHNAAELAALDKLGAGATGDDLKTFNAIYHDKYGGGAEAGKWSPFDLADSSSVKQKIGAQKTSAQQEYSDIIQHLHGVMNTSDNANLVDPRARMDAAKATEQAAIDSFTKKYGFAPNVSDDMVWGVTKDGQGSYLPTDIDWNAVDSGTWSNTASPTPRASVTQPAAGPVTSGIVIDPGTGNVSRDPGLGTAGSGQTQTPIKIADPATGVLSGVQGNGGVRPNTDHLGGDLMTHGGGKVTMSDADIKRITDDARNGAISKVITELPMGPKKPVTATPATISSGFGGTLGAIAPPVLPKVAPTVAAPTMSAPSNMTGAQQAAQDQAEEQARQQALAAAKAADDEARRGSRKRW